jgi:hypothetical protein
MARACGRRSLGVFVFACSNTNATTSPTRASPSTALDHILLASLETEFGSTKTSFHPADNLARLENARRAADSALDVGSINKTLGALKARFKIGALIPACFLNERDRLKTTAIRGPRSQPRILGLTKADRRFVGHLPPNLNSNPNPDEDAAGGTAVLMARENRWRCLLPLENAAPGGPASQGGVAVRRLHTSDKQKRRAVLDNITQIVHVGGMGSTAQAAFRHVASNGIQGGLRGVHGSLITILFSLFRGVDRRSEARFRAVFTRPFSVSREQQHEELKPRHLPQIPPATVHVDLWSVDRTRKMNSSDVTRRRGEARNVGLVCAGALDISGRFTKLAEIVSRSVSQLIVSKGGPALSSVLIAPKKMRTVVRAFQAWAERVERRAHFGSCMASELEKHVKRSLGGLSQKALDGVRRNPTSKTSGANIMVDAFTLRHITLELADLIEETGGDGRSITHAEGKIPTLTLRVALLMI